MRATAIATPCRYLMLAPVLGKQALQKRCSSAPPNSQPPTRAPVRLRGWRPACACCCSASCCLSSPSTSIPQAAIRTNVPSASPCIQPRPCARMLRYGWSAGTAIWSFHPASPLPHRRCTARSTSVRRPLSLPDSTRDCGASRPCPRRQRRAAIRAGRASRFLQLFRDCGADDRSSTQGRTPLQ